MSFLANLRGIFSPGGAAIFIAFAWALVNSVDVAGSAIILFNQSGYQQSSFVISDIKHEHNRRTGFYWGFTGNIEGQKERYYAPTLVTEKEPGLLKLRKLFPVGKKMDILYNPKVTETLVQRRTLRVLPYRPDFVSAEIDRLIWFAKFCLLPLLLAVEFDRYWRGRKPPTP